MHVKKNYCANKYSGKHVTLGKKFTNKERAVSKFENNSFRWKDTVAVGL